MKLSTSTGDLLETAEKYGVALLYETGKFILESYDCFEE